MELTAKLYDPYSQSLVKRIEDAFARANVKMTVSPENTHLMIDQNMRLFAISSVNSDGVDYDHAEMIAEI